MAEHRETTGTLGGHRIRATVERIGSRIHGYARLSAEGANGFLKLHRPKVVTYVGPVIQEDGSVRDEKCVVKSLNHKRIPACVGVPEEISVSFRG